MDSSVFDHLAKRFSECEPDDVEGLMKEAAQAFLEAISSKAIEFEDAPNHLFYVPKKKAKGGGKRMAYDIYWLNAVYWICVNRREIFPDWPGNRAAELLWTVQFHPDRLVEGSLDETILHLKSVLEALCDARGDEHRKEEIRRSSIAAVWLDLMSLCADVCSYLAHILTSKKEPAEAGEKSKTNVDGDWSKPMSKSEMMLRVGIDGYKKFNTFANEVGLKEAGNRQLWQIRLDTLDRSNRQKLEKA